MRVYTAPEMPLVTTTADFATAQLSSRERSKQMDDVIAQMKEIIKQVQLLTAVLQALDEQGVRVERDGEGWTVPALAPILARLDALEARRT